jgi:hypothetical protein
MPARRAVIFPLPPARLRRGAGILRSDKVFIIVYIIRVVPSGISVWAVPVIRAVLIIVHLLISFESFV